MSENESELTFDELAAYERGAATESLPSPYKEEDFDGIQDDIESDEEE